VIYVVSLLSHYIITMLVMTRMALLWVMLLVCFHII